MERLLEILEPWLRASVMLSDSSNSHRLVHVRKVAAAELCEFIREVADA